MPNLPTPTFGSYYTPSGMGQGGGMGAAGGIGSIVGGLSSLFGGENPADAAMPYLNQMTDKAGGYLNDYSNVGKSTLPILQQLFGKLTSDPGGLLNKFGQSYQQSPGYKFSVDEATHAANNAAAAGGLLGSPQEQYALSKQVSGMASQDYNNFMQLLMQMFGLGTSGYNNLAGMGLQAGQSMADVIKEQGRDQAQLAYEGANANNGRFGGALGDIASGVASFLL